MVRLPYGKVKLMFLIACGRFPCIVLPYISIIWILFCLSGIYIVCIITVIVPLMVLPIMPLIALAVPRVFGLLRYVLLVHKHANTG